MDTSIRSCAAFVITEAHSAPTTPLKAWRLYPRSGPAVGTKKMPSLIPIRLGYPSVAIKRFPYRSRARLSGFTTLLTLLASKPSK